MIRFLALKLISEDQTLIVKIGNVVVSSNNRIRLLTRIAGTILIGVAGALAAIIPSAILLAILFFEETQNCGYYCGGNMKSTYHQTKALEFLTSLQDIKPLIQFKSMENLVISANFDNLQN